MIDATALPVSPTRHAGLRWSPATRFDFCRSARLATLVAGECRAAAMNGPLAFVRTADDHVLPVALLGLGPDPGAPPHNLFVDANGRWRGRYVPAALRAYPFTMGKAAGPADAAAAGAPASAPAPVLCAYFDSGLIGEQGTLPLFDEAGKPAEALGKVLAFLQAVHAGENHTRSVCAVLTALELLVPWPVTLQVAAGQRQVNGLLHVDEHRLNALPDTGWAQLRQVGGLAMIYAQLQSEQMLPGFLQAATAPHEAPPRDRATPANLDFLQEDHLDFSSLLD